MVEFELVLEGKRKAFSLAAHFKWLNLGGDRLSVDGALPGLAQVY